jgi:16S rRNA (guanine527-N7)-methyltransferase
VVEVSVTPGPPEGAAAVFGEALPAAQRFAELLAGPGVVQGVVGPAEAERIWDRHLLNCAALARLIPARCALVDLGSGAGLPGIVLAMLVPGARVTLLEAMARRVAFLEECVAELGLTNAHALRGRAEDVAGQVVADVVAVRAVASLDKLAGLAIGLLRPGGRVLAIKGASAESELTKARPVLARLGVADARVSEVVGADPVAAATVVSFTAPERRISDHSGRSDARWAGGKPGGQVGRGAGSRGPVKNARPNSRRGGG